MAVTFAAFILLRYTPSGCQVRMKHSGAHCFVGRTDSCAWKNTMQIRSCNGHTCRWRDSQSTLRSWGSKLWTANRGRVAMESEPQKPCTSDRPEQRDGPSSVWLCLCDQSRDSLWRHPVCQTTVLGDLRLLRA